MPSFKDQLGKEIFLSGEPKRIISLVPSQTELLHYLGLKDEVVGITKFCIHPKDWFTSKSRIGGTKKVDLKKVKELNPDLIIGNKEENVKEQIDELLTIAPVWISDVNTIDDALDMISNIGEVVGRKEEALDLRSKISNDFRDLEDESGFKGASALYLIWDSPEYAAGRMTFIDDIIKTAGWKNVMNENRYPEITGEESPDFVFLSSEPFPFNESHISKFQKMYPKAKVVLVDGEMFSWYGSRLLKTPEYIRSLKQDFTVYKPS